MGTQITTDFFTANGKGFVLQGPLQEILLQKPAHGVRAVPLDVPACRLEFGLTPAYPTGAWFGDVGHLTKAQADSWYASGVFALLASGSTATIAGVSSTYQPGVGWVAQSMSAAGIIYNGTTIPLPVASAANIGQQILVVNPAVPRGFSRLESTGTMWAPPSGELIVAANVPPVTAAQPVADVTPGVTTVVQVYQGPVIPDYMLPLGLRIVTRAKFRITNPGTGVAGAQVGCGISGSAPNMLNYNDFPNGISVTPPVYQLGNNTEVIKPSIRTSSKFGNCPSSVSSTDSDDQYGLPFVAGANRLYCTAKPSSMTDRVIFWWGHVVSEGSL